jgi:uncharacterized membrane protein YgdD (TMEM256/DUF423 family)
MWNRLVLVVACILGGSAVAIGAFQVHGLGGMLDKWGVEASQAAKRIDNCETAVRYQLVHALAILTTAALAVASRRRMITAPLLMTVGVCCFSGGLYEIVLRGQATHWAVVPFGGLLLIFGWAALAVSSSLAAGNNSNAESA